MPKPVSKELKWMKKLRQTEEMGRQCQRKDHGGTEVGNLPKNSGEQGAMGDAPMTSQVMEEVKCKSVCCLSSTVLDSSFFTQ